MKKTTMLSHLGTIKRVIDELDPDFYDISFTNSSVMFQGHLDPSLIVKCKANSYTMETSPSGYLEFRKDNICITLTQ